MKLALFFYCLVPVFFLLSGCKPPKVDAVSPATPAAVAIPVEKHAALRVFLDDYCESVLAYDGDAAAVAWNNSKLAGMIFDIPSLSDSKKNQAIKIFTDALEEKDGGLMNANLGSSMEVINLRNVDGETRAMCRLFAIEGMNYLDIVIQENNQGAFEFIDAYSFTTGEMLSVTMRQLMMPVMATIWKTPVQKLFGGGDAYANAVANIGLKIQEGDTEGAIELIETLPEKVRNERRLLTMKIMLASRMMADSHDMERGEEIYDEAILTFESLYADEPSFLLMGLDHYFIQQDWEKLDQALNRLDEKVGGDSFLNLYRVNAFIEQGRLKECEPLLELMVKDFPELEESYWCQVQYGLANTDYDYVAERLSFIAEKFELEIDLDVDESYQEFADSEIGQSWKKKHAVWLRKLNQQNSGTPTPHRQRKE